MALTRSRRIIAVLGSGRSGTSAIARALAVLGVDLGSNLMPAQQGANDKGFWEDRDVYELNNDLLAALSRNWHDLLPISLDGLAPSVLNGFVLRGSEVLRRKLASGKPFGVKEPQLTRLLPFWKRVFSHLQLQASYIVCCRNPMSVAVSLQKHAGFGLRKCYLSWYAHTFEALEGVLNEDALVVDYDEMLADPAQQLWRISSRFVLPFESGGDSFAEYQGQFLDGGLRHQRFHREDLLQSNAVPAEVRGLYSLAEKLAKDDVALTDRAVVAEMSAFAKQNQIRHAALSYAMERELESVHLSRQVEERGLDINALADQVRALIVDRDAQILGLEKLKSAYDDLRELHDAEVRRLVKLREGKDAESESLKEALQTASNKCIELRALAEERGERATTLEQALRASAESRAALQSAIEKKDEQYRGVEQALRASEESRAELQRSIEEKDEQYRGMVQALRASDENCTALRALVAEQDQEIQMNLQAREVIEKEVARLAQAYDAFQDQRKHDVAGLGDALKAVSDAQITQIALLTEKLHSVTDSVIALSGKNESLVARLAATKEEYRRAVAESDNRAEQLDSLREKLAGSDACVAGLEAALESLSAKNQHLSAGVDELAAQVCAIVSERDDAVASWAKERTDLECRLSVVGREAENAKVEMERARHHIASLEQSLSALYQSRSWRLTAPARRLRSWCSRAIHGLLSPFTSVGAAGGQHMESPVAGTPKQKFASKVLLVSYYCPTRAHAGGLRILDIYASIKEANPAIQVDLYTHHRPAIDWSIDEACAIFDNVYLSPVEELSVAGLRALGCAEAQYDVVDLQFHQSGRYIEEFRAVGDKLIFTPMESMVRVFLIGLRSAFSNPRANSFKKHREALRNALEEVSYCRKVDQVVCVSRSDAAVLRLPSWPTNVTGFETGLSKIEFGDALDNTPRELSAESGQQRVLYVAYFGSQTNVDALKWYLDNVHARIRERVPGYVLMVVGRGDMSPFSAYLGDGSIEIVGEVPQIGPYIEQACVGIAPALSGSGFRGKVNQYALFGVPSVVSPISVKGLAYKDKLEILVAKSACEFADSCIRLLADPALRSSMGDAARKKCLNQYTWSSRADQLSDIYRLRKNMLKGEPRITALVPSYNHGSYLRQRISSIIGQTYKNVELIVIDDGSPDNSDGVIRELLETEDFKYIRNEKNSGTPFAAWERVAEIATGDYIWVCESDDFAEPTFLQTAVRALTADQSAVIYYCNSWVVDEVGQRIGDTSEYFANTWRDGRWNRAFSSNGRDELVHYQQRGQIVPNMSSAVIESEAFKASYKPMLKKFKLAGDWLFIGWVLEHGNAIFAPDKLSNFRKHEVTSRVRVQSARSQAEFILTKFLLFQRSGRRASELSSVLATDAIRFAYESACWHEVLRAMLQISWGKTFRCGVVLAYSVALRPGLIRKFANRYVHAKGLTK